eukprot:scaffold74987_cov31-Tisochrysis_lutea.AAC.1
MHHAGIIHEDIWRAPSRLDQPRQSASHLSVVERVEGQHCAFGRRMPCLDGVAGLEQCLLLASGEHDVRAALGQPARHL